METPRQQGQGPGLPTVFALYTLARIGVVVVISGALVLANVPLLVAVLIALIVALPLSMFVFRGLRSQLDMRIAEAGQRRRAEREALRARLRGDVGRPTTMDVDDPSQVSAEHHADGRRDRPAEQQRTGVDQHSDQPASADTTEHPAREDHGER